jgi:glutamine synthetase
MEKHGVMSRTEMAARDEIHIEKYCSVISIEANTLMDMVRREIIPAVSLFESILCSTVAGRMQTLSANIPDVESALCRKLAVFNSSLSELVEELGKKLETAPPATDYKAAKYYREEVLSLMESIRKVVDEEEKLIPDKYWPYPSFRRLLFSV